MLIDAHVHFDSLAVHDAQLRDLQYSGAERFSVVVTDRISRDPEEFKLAQAIYLKLRHPQMVYLFAGVDWTGVFDEHRPEPRVPLVQQVQRLIDIGCDGLKLLAGKPTHRKAVGLPLDGPVLDKLFAFLEDTGFPILSHVNDPPEFWSEHTVPLWARQRGWWYDASHPSYSQIQAEAYNMLQRHRRLNMILPHFFFLSDRLEQAADLLNRFPRLYLDLAPGVEMYHNFTANRATAREFFIRYADRIIYGTDSGLMNHISHRDRPRMVQRFLETADRFPVPPDPVMSPDDRPDLHGLALPADVVDRIYSRNYLRLLGHDLPRPLSPQPTLALLQSLADESPEAVTARQVLELARQQWA